MKLPNPNPKRPHPPPPSPPPVKDGLYQWQQVIRSLFGPEKRSKY